LHVNAQVTPRALQGRLGHKTATGGPWFPKRLLITKNGLFVRQACERLIQTNRPFIYIPSKRRSTAWVIYPSTTIKVPPGKKAGSSQKRKKAGS
jgi:hypothetical protein